MVTKNSPTNMRAFVRSVNTNDSDNMQFVPHFVQYDLGGKSHSVEIYATDPMDAIKKVRDRLK